MKKDQHEELLELYNIRFKNSLVGKWIPISQTFFLMEDSFEFLKNGEGIWKSSSGMGEEIIKFKWKQNEPYIILIQEEEETEWIPVQYTFKIKETDLTKEIILAQENSDFFYLAMTPITYSEKSGLLKMITQS